MNRNPLNPTKARHGTNRFIGKTTLSKFDLGIHTPTQRMARKSRTIVRQSLGNDALDDAFGIGYTALMAKRDRERAEAEATPDEAGRASKAKMSGRALRRAIRFGARGYEQPNRSRVQRLSRKRRTGGRP